jgi:hypothetical protein
MAWSPSGLRIAYVACARGRFQLRLIEGDGDHDRLVDASVRPVRPVWRRDSLAVRYVGAGGHETVYDLARRAHRVLGRAAPRAAVDVDAAPALRIAATPDRIESRGRTLLRADGIELVAVR